MQEKFESQMTIIRDEKRYGDPSLNESILEAFYSLRQDGLENELSKTDGRTALQALILTNEGMPHRIPFFVQTALFLTDCNTNIKDREGNTALHTLFDSFSKFIGRRNKWGTPEEVGDTGEVISFHLTGDILPAAAVLVASGADVNAKNNKGQTPFEILEGMKKTLTPAEFATVKTVDTSVSGLISHYNAKVKKVLTAVYPDGSIYALGIPEPFSTVNSFEKLNKIDEAAIRTAAASIQQQPAPARVQQELPPAQQSHAARVQANRAQAADAEKKGCCTIL